MYKVKQDRERILDRLQRHEIDSRTAYQLLTSLQTKLRTQNDDTRASGPLIQTESNIVLESSNSSNREPKRTDIAVIGMSGRFPGAKDLKAYWYNLENGVDSVEEILPQRWDIDQYYDPKPGVPHKTYCRTSGLLADADCFDPLFFNISPREAELMDPQQRLFLEESWKAIEDAGYSAEELSGVRCGVFAGVMQCDYMQAAQAEVESPDAQSIAGSGNCFLPARVSYFLNLTGPSVAIDTACSSSLVAIHQACRALINQEAELALAGGVSVIATPYHHVSGSKSEMLSRVGRCQSFDNGADGFVPSEGVGVLLLKPLDRALRDGDHVYGVIKGSSVNHDGKTNGLTAPSSKSQTQLELEVYRSCGIDPCDISYVEAHGTGTKLGDPIEINALSKTFREFTEERGFCAIGSVKSNIGHSLAAAGVAGIIKVLLSMQYRKIVPSINYQTPNEHIDFQDSPFYVNTELRDWSMGNGDSMLAAISSFGLSGTNCHMLVGEMPAVEESKQDISSIYLIPLSAKNDKALYRRAADLRDWLELNPKINLNDLVYTLSVGRVHFNKRAALVVTDHQTLLNGLNSLSVGKASTSVILFGKPSSNSLEDAKSIIAELMEQNDSGNSKHFRARLERLAKAYVNGASIEWAQVNRKKRCKRVSLPTYPFARNRYWIADVASIFKSKDVLDRIARLHPLIDRNVSTLHEQRFVRRFSKKELLLTDHVVNGGHVLPGTAMLELARAAGALAAQEPISAIENVMWSQAVIVGDTDVDVEIVLRALGEKIQFEIHSVDSDGRGILHVDGKLRHGHYEPVAGLDDVLDIDAIRRRCTLEIKRSVYYEQWKQAGIHYGSSFRVILNLSGNDSEALAEIELPSTHVDTSSEYMLHPILLDAALQSVAGIQSSHTEALLLPSGVGSIDIIAPIPRQCIAYARLTSMQESTGFLKFDICVTDMCGQILVRIREFTVRALHHGRNTDVNISNDPIMHLIRDLEKGKLEIGEAEKKLKEMLYVS